MRKGRLVSKDRCAAWEDNPCLVPVPTWLWTSPALEGDSIYTCYPKHHAANITCKMR